MARTIPSGFPDANLHAFFHFYLELWSTEICRRLQRPSVRVNSPLHLPVLFHPPAECPPQLISPACHLLCTHSFAKNSLLPNYKISIVTPLFTQRIFLNSLIEKMPQFIMTISFRRAIACCVHDMELENSPWKDQHRLVRPGTVIVTCLMLSTGDLWARTPPKASRQKQVSCQYAIEHILLYMALPPPRSLLGQPVHKQWTAIAWERNLF